MLHCTQQVVQLESLHVPSSCSIKCDLEWTLLVILSVNYTHKTHNNASLTRYEVEAQSAKGSHIDACRSVCDQDQNEIKWSTFFLGADQGIKTNSEKLISSDQHTFSDTQQAWQRFILWTLVESSDQEPQNGAIKQSRTIFHRSIFLIPVANASTGDIYVTPLICTLCHLISYLLGVRAGRRLYFRVIVVHHATVQGITGKWVCFESTKVIFNAKNGSPPVQSSDCRLPVS